MMQKIMMRPFVTDFLAKFKVEPMLTSYFSMFYHVISMVFPSFLALEFEGQTMQPGDHLVD
jgi:hypothetical protein